MENNQQTSESASALEAMTLQETIMMGTEQEEQSEIFHDSLSEAQWQQQLNDQLTVTDLGSQAQGKTTEETERTECRVEGSGRQHPPTQIAKNPNTPNPSRQQKSAVDLIYHGKLKIWNLITVWEPGN